MEEGKKQVVAPSDEVAMALTLQMTFGQTQLILQTYVPRDWEPKLLNATLDKMTAAVDRVEAGYASRSLRQQLDSEERRADELKEELLRVQKAAKEQWAASGRKGDYKLTQAQASAITNAETSYRRTVTNLETMRARLTEFSSQRGN